MELKDFIKKTAQSIIDATSELILDNKEKGVVINPAIQSSAGAADVVCYYDGFVPVTAISFDVAVTEESEKSGSGGAKVKIATFEVGGDGKLSKIDTVVSRVAFDIRISLPAQKGPGREDRMTL